MNLTTKLKHINYALKRQQNSAPSQGAVTETIFTLLPKITTTKRKKEKWTEKEEKKKPPTVLKRLDIRQQRTAILR